MPLASRIANLSPEGAYAVMGRAQAQEAEGRHFIHLEIGQPDIETYPHIKQEGIQAIQDGFTRYNPPAGLPELLNVIAEKQEQIMGSMGRVTSGCALQHPQRISIWR